MMMIMIFSKFNRVRSLTNAMHFELFFSATKAKAHTPQGL